MSCKQCRPWSDAAFYGVWSGSTLFAQNFLSIYIKYSRSSLIKSNPPPPPLRNHPRSVTVHDPIDLHWPAGTNWCDVRWWIVICHDNMIWWSTYLELPIYDLIQKKKANRPHFPPFYYRSLTTYVVKATRVKLYERAVFSRVCVQWCKVYYT